METTKFQDFIRCVDVKDHNELYELYNAVTLKTNQNLFDVAKDSTGKIFITHKISGSKLKLLSEKTINSFIGFLENDYMNGMDGDSYWSYKRAQEE